MPDSTPGASIREPAPPLADDPAARGATAAQETKPKVCLVVLFNHRFEANLPKLDRLYRDRFPHLRYLIPFYLGDREDVIPVYQSSFQFEGFYLEAWKRLRGEGFTHFVFCADDMVLHPDLNGGNICAELGVDAGTGFIKYLLPLSSQTLAWFPMASSLVAVAGKNGVNWEKELPERAAATANLEAKGHRFRPLGWHNLRHGIRAKGFFQFLFYLVLRRQAGRDGWRELPYPLLYGVSDIIVVPGACMEKFTFYCAVFAAMGVFVEIGAPTALALSCPRVSREADNAWRMRDHWFGDELDEFCRKYDYNLERLLADFGERTLCLHPIKLSQWT